MMGMQMNRTRYSEVDAAVAAEIRVEIARNRGVSVSSIANELGMRRATLSARVNGHVAFTPGELSAVAMMLGTTAAMITSRAEAVVAAMRSPQSMKAAA